MLMMATAATLQCSPKVGWTMSVGADVVRLSGTATCDDVSRTLLGSAYGKFVSCWGIRSEWGERLDNKTMAEVYCRASSRAHLDASLELSKQDVVSREASGRLLVNGSRWRWWHADAYPPLHPTP